MANSNEQSKGQANKNWFARHKIITGILIFFIVGSIGNAIGDSKKTSSNSNSTANTNTAQENKKEVPKEAVIKVTARELYAKYEANEIKADEQYKSKLLEVSGVVESIGNDILENPYISLKGNDVIGVVQCMLADSEKSKASELSKGQSVVMEGRNSGKTIMNIILRDCIIK